MGVALFRPPRAVADIQARFALEKDRTVPSLRALRKELSRELRELPGSEVLRIAAELVKPTSSCPRWFTYELVHHHKDAMAKLTSAWLRRLGKGLSAWDETDPFACYLLGPAWREGAVSNAELAYWAKSPDRWWRRSALAATVALNIPARGGKGDTERTLFVCDLLLDDRDDMVVKAMSWALRALAAQKPDDVKRYVAKHTNRLAPRVMREVGNKLRTGLKNPK